ncbi:MAG: sigma-54-dependent transcriptional regulator [Acidobacteriota bacterium]
MADAGVPGPAARPGKPTSEPLDAPESRPFMSELAVEVERLSIHHWGVRRAVSMVGTSTAILDVHRVIGKIARFDAPVLITGESGVGKESLAQSLYLLGSRVGRPFVAVNCPQFQEGNLTVSELFGHKKGSFTGAIADRRGCFEVADGGVIFLDEIGDLHMSAQTMLLRALAFGEFQPLGSNETRVVNVRVIAATNRPADQLSAGESQFRGDLFFRLRYFLVNVPPLRERGDDWRLLLDYWLARLQAQYGVAKRFSPASMDILARYPWPGNIRELCSIVTMGYALADSTLIRPNDFISLLQSGERPGACADEDLYRRIAVDGRSFWDVVHEPFMNRDLNRAQVRSLIRRGLVKTQGSYRDLVAEFNLPDSDYQRFMDFLRHHRLKP